MFLTFPDSPFQLHQPFEPAGDQPQAIEALSQGLIDGLAFQTLLGVTGSGKTFTMANVIARAGCPTLVLAPNKTLAAQLYSEMREFFPNNAVEYFVSYYDYYQPEAYVPSRDLYIEKDSSINEHIEQMRLSATKSLLERRDVVIVATVSAIYGIGDPSDYHSMVLTLRHKDRYSQRDIIVRLTQMQYKRSELDFSRGTFRVRGDTIDIFPAEHAELAVRDRAVRRRDRLDAAVRPADRSRAPEDPALHALSVVPLRHAARQRAARDRDDQGRAEGAHRGLRCQRQAGRGAAHRAAHSLRHRDAQRAGLLQGHRELHAPHLRRHCRASRRRRWSTTCRRTR